MRIGGSGLSAALNCQRRQSYRYETASAIMDPCLALASTHSADWRAQCPSASLGRVDTAGHKTRVHPYSVTAMKTSTIFMQCGVQRAGCSLEHPRAMDYLALARQLGAAVWLFSSAEHYRAAWRG